MSIEDKYKKYKKKYINKLLLGRGYPPLHLFDNLDKLDSNIILEFQTSINNLLINPGAVVMLSELFKSLKTKTATNEIINKIIQEPDNSMEIVNFYADKLLTKLSQFKPTLFENILKSPGYLLGNLRKDYLEFIEKIKQELDNNLVNEKKVHAFFIIFVLSIIDRLKYCFLNIQVLIITFIKNLNYNINTFSVKLTKMYESSDYLHRHFHGEMGVETGRVMSRMQEYINCLTYKKTKFTGQSKSAEEIGIYCDNESLKKYINDIVINLITDLFKSQKDKQIYQNYDKCKISDDYNPKYFYSNQKLAAEYNLQNITLESSLLLFYDKNVYHLLDLFMIIFDNKSIMSMCINIYDKIKKDLLTFINTNEIMFNEAHLEKRYYE